MIKWTAFDIAGTTVNDHGHVYRALEEAVEENGVQVDANDLQTWMGADKVDAIRALLSIGGHDADDRTVSASFDRFREIVGKRYAAEPPVPLPGVVDALSELRGRGVKVALTTGFSRDVAEPLLANLGWTVGSAPHDTVDALVASSDVAAGRPAPYMIHRAMEQTGIADVRAVLAAGDTVVDTEAANNAGVLAVGVLTGKLTREEFTDQPNVVVLDSVADIPAFTA